MDVDTRGSGWQALAALLLEALGDRVAEAGHPEWVTVHEDPDGGGNFGLSFSDDARGFLGWAAPDDCLAVGMVATAKVWVDEGPAAPPEGLPPGATGGVRLACIVTRAGEVAWRLMPPGGRPFDTPPREGRLIDCFRRCFGLPTAPPPAGPRRLQSIMWLGAVLEEARRSGGGLSWREVVRLHPIAGGVCEDAHRAPDSDTLRWILDAADSIWTWEDLRSRAEQGAWALPGVSPEVAAWMDDGMFARWVLSDLPTPEELIERIRPYVAPATARRLSHTVRRAA